MGPSLNTAGGRIVAAVALLAASLWSFWPSLGAYFFLDDYAFVAISRYTDHPLSYYLSEHFPGGFFYRPSGMLLWWLTAAGDLSPKAQFTLNWLLLGCASLLLCQLLRMIGLRASVAIGAALIFAMHPIAVTTAGWLSNRFDLLMTIGLLMALIGTLMAERRTSVAALLIIGTGTLLAVTAKELGFVTPIAILALCRGKPWTRIVSPPFLVSAVLAGGIFIVRSVLLPGTEKILYPNGVVDAARRGTLAWIKSLPDFLAFVPDHPVAAMFIVALAVIGIVALSALAVAGFRARHGGDRSFDALGSRAIMLGAALFVSAALVQSPTVARSTFAMPTAKVFSGEAYFAGRFYYLALIGLLIAGAGLASVLLGPERSAMSAASTVSGNVETRARASAVAIGFGGVAFALLLGYWGWQSRVQGKLWAAESSGTNRAIAEAAAAAVKAVPIDASAAQGCRLYLVGTIDDAPRFWPFSDTIVKAAVPKSDAERIASCLISTERTPWYHVLRATHERAQPGNPAAPYESICLFGKILPALVVDSVVMHYLAYPRNGETLAISANDRVLRYDAHARTFDDVTSRVASGELVVQLKRSRSQINACPEARPAS